MSDPLVDLEQTYLFAAGTELLRVEATALWKRLMEGTPGGPAVERVATDAGWLVGLFRYGESWPSWEMHPAADEIVHVVSGSFEFVLEQDGAERRIPVDAGQTLVVPRGAWHRAIVHAPGAALHVTFGRGTEHRPAA